MRLLLILTMILWNTPLSYAAERESRLSAMVALVSQDENAATFLRNPGKGYIEAYMMFDSALGKDVIMGLDLEMIEGIENPHFIKGGDWMAFVGVQRTGVLWVATGTDDTLRGKPSRDRKWETISLGSQLKPLTWYRLRVEADFSHRRFLKFSIESADMKKTVDLSGYLLDYPNYMPFNKGFMSYYVHAMRGKALMAPEDKNASARVYFDDVEGGAISNTGQNIPIFKDGFESLAPITGQPVTLPVVDLDRYVQGQWYLEREESLATMEALPNTHSGKAVGIVDARLSDE
ncbi:MAG: hypothetical protein HYS17_04100 [Micavibrio aeruginosavorus]|uniref:Uncharacterized protein n=1 Tax=Micavibrio aeruginosavorus TaxID=349221 RepID=A0A7T5UHH5_9BACT|nr:MAG: hypothetical protein HYS17_04100 [Micavibrio aeruginosavorus]